MVAHSLLETNKTAIISFWSLVIGRVSESKVVGAITYIFSSSIPGPNLWDLLCNFCEETKLGKIMGEGVLPLVCQVGRHNASCILHSNIQHSSCRPTICLTPALVRGQSLPRFVGKMCPTELRSGRESQYPPPLM